MNRYRRQVFIAVMANWKTVRYAFSTLHYMTCHLLDAFIQSDLYTFSTVDNPHRSNVGWSVSPRDTTTCWLQWDSNLLSPDLKSSTLTTKPQPCVFSIMCYTLAPCPHYFWNTLIFVTVHSLHIRLTWRSVSLLLCSIEGFSEPKETFSVSV